MSVVFLASDKRGGGRLRSIWPAQNLADRGWTARVAFGWPGGLGRGDIVVIHRPLAVDILQWVRSYQEAGVKVIVDEDDELGAIPLANRWQASRQQLKRHDQAIREADALVVTTDRLAEVYGTFNQRVFVVRNRMPAWVQDRAMIRGAGGHPVVGWAGVIDVHKHDLRWLAPHSRAAMQGARFVAVGDRRALSALKIRGGSHPWQEDVNRFYKLMSLADIGIVPLDNKVNRDFNTSKSWLKALEYMTLGRPVVATDLPEQRRLIDHGETGFLADTPKEFAEYVQTLVRDPSLRRQMGRAALERARAEALEEHTDWEEMLIAVTEGSQQVRPSRLRRARPARQGQVLAAQAGGSA